MGVEGRRDSATPSESRRSKIKGVGLSSKEHSLQKGNGKVVRFNEFCLPSLNLGKALDSSNLQLGKLSHSSSFQRPSSSHLSCAEVSFTPLEGFFSKEGGGASSVKRTSFGSDDRCFFNGVRSLLGSKSSVRILGQGSKSEPHKLERTDVRSSGLSKVVSSVETQTCSSVFRQFDSGELPKTSGLLQVSPSSFSSKPSLGILCHPEDSTVSGIYSRPIKRKGRLSFQSKTGSDGMVPRERYFSVDPSKIWPSTGRLVRVGTKCATKDICHSVSLQKGCWAEYPACRLVQVEAEIHLPSDKTYSSSPPITSVTSQVCNSGGSFLAQPRLVPSLKEAFSQTDKVVQVQVKPMGKREAGVPPQPKFLGPSCVVFLLKTLQKSLPLEAATILAHKSSSSTLARYQSHWKRFVTFAGGRQVATPVVLDYFMSLFSQGLEVRTILVHKSALMDPLFYGFNLNLNDKIYSDFLKGLKTKRPLKKLLPPSWEVGVVLAFLKSPSFRDNESIDVASLLLKTLFLVGLATGSRISEISALRRDILHCKFWPNKDGVDLCTKADFRYKSERFLKKAPILVIPSLKKVGNKVNPLCPVDALRVWLNRTKSWVNPENKIWMNAATKLPANARLLGLRFKALIRISHNDERHANFHELRKVATSLAFDQGLSLKDLRARANWRGDSVFFKHYYSPQSVKQICIAMGKRLN